MLENIKIKNKRSVILKSFSRELWDIHWERFFPEIMSEEGVYFDLCPFNLIQDFFIQHQDLLQDKSEQDSPFLMNDDCLYKKKFYQQFADCFAFFYQHKIVGAFIGHPLDWSSYYFRYVNVLPGFRGQDLCRLASESLINILREYKIHRIESDVSPSNLHQVNRLNKMQFNITGVTLSERWGSLLRHTKYISSIHEKTFIEQFCYGLRPQIKP